jgi:hypothetical protein
MLSFASTPGSVLARSQVEGTGIASPESGMNEFDF